eukprot:CAMPEP_0175226284 /NCGR_PEP_ID=MMETSP0093-20121207/22817_1 /TAXON_ID=311494 /ORGANISM="Alexandrium monilatum, Strain CCMP3105" /LENGTH=70 /DNA_ID=CAMNT_0016520011 /DNA_START=26 /DNA_END=235 /DNA_ORIENTATION=+
MAACTRDRHEPSLLRVAAHMEAAGAAVVEMAAAALVRQSWTALLQSPPAVRCAGSGVVKTSPSSMMQGGT